MKSKSIKKVLVLAVSFLLLLLLLYALLGWFPIAGKLIAEHRVNAWAAASYGESEPVKMGFDFYHLTPYKGGGYIYDLRSGMIFDAALAEQEHADSALRIEQAARQLPAQIQLTDAYISPRIDGRELSRRDTLVIHQLANSSADAGQQGPEYLSEIILSLIDSDDLSGYCITGLSVTCFDRSGCWQCILPDTSDEALTAESLTANTKRIENPGTAYTEWLDSLPV